MGGNHREAPPAAILAGGLATRLRPSIHKIPKALVEIAGRPFIFHLLDQLKAGGVERVVLCVGHLGEQIVEAVGDGGSFGLRVEYSFDGEVLLGTAGALKRAASLLSGEFFVLNGDTYLEADFLEAHDAFQSSGRLGLMTLYRNEGQVEPSNVLFADGEIVTYDKVRRTPEMKHIDCGLGLLKREALLRVPDGEPYDLARLHRELIDDGQLVGYEVTKRYYEIGSLAGIAEADAYFTALQTHPGSQERVTVRREESRRSHE